MSDLGIRCINCHPFRGYSCTTQSVSTLSCWLCEFGEFLFTAHLGGSTKKCMNGIEEIEQVVTNQCKLQSVTSIQPSHSRENANMLKFSLYSMGDIMFDSSCFLVWEH